MQVCQKQTTVEITLVKKRLHLNLQESKAYLYINRTMEKSVEKPPEKNNEGETSTPSEVGVENGLSPSKQYTQAVQQWLWQYHMHCSTYQWMASTWQFYSTYVALNPPPVPGATPRPGTPAAGGVQFPGPGQMGVNHGLQQPGGQQQQQQVGLCCISLFQNIFFFDTHQAVN